MNIISGHAFPAGSAWSSNHVHKASEGKNRETEGGEGENHEHDDELKPKQQ